jgi:hypothetical protein
MPASASTGATAGLVSVLDHSSESSELGLEGCHWVSSGEGFPLIHRSGLACRGFCWLQLQGQVHDAKINCSLVRVYKLLEGRLRGWSGFQVCWQLGCSWPQA